MSPFGKKDQPGNDVDVALTAEVNRLNALDLLTRLGRSAFEQNAVDRVLGGGHL
jgi:hypothetical protein